MKTFSELTIGDKLYSVDTFGHLEIDTITHITFSMNNEKVRVCVNDGYIKYFIPTHTSYYAEDFAVFIEKEDAIKYLKGLYQYHQQIMEKVNESIKRIE